MPPEWQILANLDEDSTQQWIKQCDDRTPGCQGSLSTVTQPAMNGRALKLSLTGGNSSSNVRFYKDFPTDSITEEFIFDLFFKYDPVTTFNNAPNPSIIQAIEFSVSKWQDSTRWQWAIQWENVDAGGAPGKPDIRIWSGMDWVDTGIKLELNTTWHHLTLHGEIRDKQARYISLKIDEGFYELDRYKYQPRYEDKPDKTAIHIQLDGAIELKAYDVFVDEVLLLFR